MPPKRSTRAASTKPVEKSTEAAAKVAKRSRSQPPKRPTPPDESPEQTQEQVEEAAPAAKRSRTAKKEESSTEDKPKPKTARSAAKKAKETETENGAAEPAAVDDTTAIVTDAPVKEAKPKAAPKPRAKSKERGTALRRTASLHLPPGPPMNALPTPPEHSRPALQLFGCGVGNFGQLGMGADFLAEYPKPKRNMLVEKKMQEGAYGEEGAGLESVAAGGMHTLFVDEKGTVWSFGVNDEGALGRVTTNVPNPEKEGEFLDVDELTSVPHPVQTLLDENFRAVKICAGDSVSAAISDKGELRVWGSFRGNQGSLGFSSDSQRQFLPTAVLELKTPARVDPEKFVGVAAGNNHLLVLTNYGNIFTLGAGEEGQLGRRVLERRKIHGTNPEKVVLGARSRKAVLVGAGNNASFAVDDAGDTWAWGLNTKGQTGTGFASAQNDGEVHQPKRVLGLTRVELNGACVVDIAGGDHHTLFLTSDGRVYACGRSDEGQLGLADNDPQLENRPFEDFHPEPVRVMFPDMNDPVRAISAGTHGNWAATEGGALYAWGAQTQGELGLGDEPGSKTPKVVVRKEGGGWSAVKVSCGGQHSVALLRKKTDS